jgi:hypothetical protein
MVIAVQTNDATLAALAGLRDLDLILRQLIKGGEIAVLSYGDQVRTVQSFTSDSAKAALPSRVSRSTARQPANLTR